MPTACIAAVLLATALLQEPTSAEEDAVARAEAAFAQERYAEAADAFGEAYTAHPLPRYLWAQAQAERLAGDCAAAIEVYDAFLATEPAEKDAADARDARKACERELERREPADTETKHAATTTSPTEGSASTPAGEPEPLPSERPPLRWYRDPWGGALVGSGVFVGGIGIGLLVSAVRLDRDAGDASTEGAYEASREDAVLRQRVGIATVAVGSGLVVAGVVRWAIVGARGRRSRTAFVPAPMGVAVVGRF